MNSLYACSCLSVPKSELCESPLRVLHDDHGSAVAEEHTLTPRYYTSEESFDALLLINVLRAFVSAPSEILASSLRLIFEHLERPDDPEAQHGSRTAAEELAHLVIENIGVPSHTVDDAEISRHQT
jgi:hypothetical protein